MSTVIPKSVNERLSRTINPFQKILASAQQRDVNESNTVTVVTDMLADVFGWDKYLEVTSEQAIRGTYCDLAVQTDGSIQFLIEVKAVGLELKDNHLRQAINYGANEGIPWVVLTNGRQWQVYRIKFEKPVSHEFVCDFDFLEISSRKPSDREQLFLLCREAVAKDAINQYHERAQTVNRFVLAELIRSPAIVGSLRREMRRLLPSSRVTTEEVENMLPLVLKRDVLDGEFADKARSQVRRGLGRKLRKSKGVDAEKRATTTVMVAFACLLAFGSVDAQMPEGGEWRMFGAPMPTNLDFSEGWASRYWVAPVWLYNTRTGTVYRVIGRRDELSHVCDEFGVAPCLHERLVPVPLALLNDETGLLTEAGVGREPQPGDWQMFARESSAQNIHYQAENYGAWLYNAYTGTVYEVRPKCYIDTVVGCLFRVPVRDSYNQPAPIDAQASGVMR